MLPQNILQNLQFAVVCSMVTTEPNWIKFGTGTVPGAIIIISTLAITHPNSIKFGIKIL